MTDTAAPATTLTRRQREVLDMLRKRGELGIEPAGRGRYSVSTYNHEPWYHVSRSTLKSLVNAGVAEWRSSCPDLYPHVEHYAVAPEFEHLNPYRPAPKVEHLKIGASVHATITVNVEDLITRDYDQNLDRFAELALTGKTTDGFMELIGYSVVGPGNRSDTVKIKVAGVISDRGPVTASASRQLTRDQEPPVGTWVRDRHDGVTFRQQEGWGAPGTMPFGRWTDMWDARGPLVECSPWGATLDH
ncbi:hypothetical protein [Agromyces humi]|uniref:hypothetical protein n=1 Tax=Agromyces humi TaxID=1766800 RepID=UPI00135B221D|nr:hypothetical protein [Agromyces humi]